MRELIAGVDLGGTNVRIAISDCQAPEVFLTHVSEETPVAGGPDAFLDLVRSGVLTCLAHIDAPLGNLKGIGCTIPGITDAANGRALLVTNLPGWDNFPIQDRLSSLFDLPAAIDNDVNAAALGEYWYGQGRGTHSVVYLTVSTGIAAGIVVDGVLLRGFNHAAGEMGFFVPDARLLPQSWEPNGCLELTSAGVGLVQQYEQKGSTGAGNKIGAKEIFVKAKNGDRVAQEVVNNAADYLAQAVIGLATIIDPQKIVLSGSIVQHQAQVYDRICEMTKKHIPHAPDLVLSEFDGDAPLIGALALIARSLA